MRTALRWIIKAHADWQVCGEATNGLEGISAAARLKPDVVLLDFSMPVMNGIAAAVGIKRRMPDTRLLMFTSYAAPAIEEAARSAGIEAVIDKGDHASFLRALQQFERAA